MTQLCVQKQPNPFSCHQKVTLGRQIWSRPDSQAREDREGGAGLYLPHPKLNASYHVLGLCLPVLGIIYPFSKHKPPHRTHYSPAELLVHS